MPVPPRRRLLTTAAVLVMLNGLSGCATRTEDVVFRNGKVSLAGTFHRPRSGTRFPSILLVHGDGPDTRAGYDFLAGEFAAGGVAALAYDKRGAGRSSGKWPARFAELAGDAVAGLEYLRSRGDVNPECVGVWGGSQGGWIAPLAAASTRVSYVVVKSGTPLGPAELTRWKSVNRVQRAGYGSVPVERVNRLMNLQFQILRGEDRWDGLEREVAIVAREPWFPLVAVMRHSTWRSSWMQYGPDIDFDPLPVLAGLDVPMLWLLGERDPEVPLERTVAGLEELRRRGKKVTVHVFPGADHQIELPRQVPDRPNFAPGYVDLMIEWVKGRCPAR